MGLHWLDWFGVFSGSFFSLLYIYMYNWGGNSLVYKREKISLSTLSKEIFDMISQKECEISTNIIKNIFLFCIWLFRYASRILNTLSIRNILFALGSF